MHVHQFPTGQAREGSEHHFFYLIPEEPETYYEWVDLCAAIQARPPLREGVSSDV